MNNLNIKEMFEELNKLDDEKIHLSELINKINAIYFYGDVEDVYYQNELNEEEGNNTLPEDTIISKEDVSIILNKIKDCNTLFIEARPINHSFLDKYKLDVDDCKNILNQLTVNDYVKSTTSTNSKHFGNNLIIFEPSTIIIEDTVFMNLLIYIKIDLDESTDTSIAVVSFYDTNYRDELPYNL